MSSKPLKTPFKSIISPGNGSPLANQFHQPHPEVQPHSGPHQRSRSTLLASITSPASWQRDLDRVAGFEYDFSSRSSRATSLLLTAPSATPAPAPAPCLQVLDICNNASLSHAQVSKGISTPKLHKVSPLPEHLKIFIYTHTPSCPMRVITITLPTFTAPFITPFTAALFRVSDHLISLPHAWSLVFSFSLILPASCQSLFSTCISLPLTSSLRVRSLAFSLRLPLSLSLSPFFSAHHTTPCTMHHIPRAINLHCTVPCTMHHIPCAINLHHPAPCTLHAPHHAPHIFCAITCTAPHPSHTSSHFETHYHASNM